MPNSTFLPDHFYALLGRYVATCGHIEQAAAFVVFVAEGRDPQNIDHRNSHFRMMRRIDDLIAGLRASASLMPSRLAARTRAVASRMEKGRDARALFVHGAWSLQSDGSYEVRFTKNFAKGKANDWRPWIRAITDDGIIFALKDADWILSTLIRIHRDLLEARGNVPPL